MGFGCCCLWNRGATLCFRPNFSRRLCIRKHCRVSRPDFGKFWWPAGQIGKFWCLPGFRLPILGESGRYELPAGWQISSFRALAPFTMLPALPGKAHSPPRITMKLTLPGTDLGLFGCGSRHKSTNPKSQLLYVLPLETLKNSALAHKGAAHSKEPNGIAFQASQL